MDWPRQAEAFFQLARERGLRGHPQVEAYLRASLAAGQTSALGVACSGGADSLALLLWLHGSVQHARAQRRASGKVETVTGDCSEAAAICGVHVLHLNHNLRGEHSRADAAFVAEVASALGLPFVGECAEPWAGDSASPQRAGATAPASSSSSPSVVAISEERLRMARHAFYERSGCGIIFQGHHSGDVAETMLMRLSTGSGINGLCAPRPVSDRGGGRPVFLRPLLDWDREVVVSILRELGIPWREDASNAGNAYFRNRVRNTVLPTLQAAAGRDVLQAMGRSRELLQEDADALEQWLDSLWGTALSPAVAEGGKGVSLDWRIFAGQPRALQRRALWRWLGLCGIAAVFTGAALELLLSELAVRTISMANAGQEGAEHTGQEAGQERGAGDSGESGRVVESGRAVDSGVPFRELRFSAGADHFVCYTEGRLMLEPVAVFRRSEDGFSTMPFQAAASSEAVGFVTVSVAGSGEKEHSAAECEVTGATGKTSSGDHFAELLSFPLPVADSCLSEGAGALACRTVSWLELPLGGRLILEAVELTDDLRRRIFSGEFSPEQQVYLAADYICGSASGGLPEAMESLASAPIAKSASPLAVVAAAAVSVLGVRYWQRGDAYRPLGAPGRRKVQDCLTDRKIPRQLRHNLPVVVDSRNGDILWVACLPSAQQCVLGDNTKWALRLTYESLYRKL